MTTKAAAVASTACTCAPLSRSHRFENHDAGEQEQQRRLGERGDAFDLAVAVLMLGVGRLAGNAHGEIGEQRRREVQQANGPASDRMASEPVSSPIAAFAAVRPAEAAIDPSAAFSLGFMRVSRPRAEFASIAALIYTSGWLATVS